MTVKIDSGIYKKTIPNEQYQQKLKQSCNKDKVDLILLYVKRGQCTWFSLDRNRF